MSIKYLQDQQLNQVQQSPNNSPWAKLVAQSEMLERNKMRQPQGQAPQGTVAGNIQQQLIDAQMKQESESQNADLYKSQMLAQLIGSGQIPANFAAQGYASGGLTQPGTGTYAGIMVPSQQPATSARMPNYMPPNSQDPNAQEKKHGLLQSMIDNSIFKAPTTENFMSNLGDMASGKFLSRGFAEGGDIRGFAAGGESMAEFKNRMYGADPSVVNPARSNLMGTLLNVAEQKEALANQPITEKLREAGKAGYNKKTILDTMANKMSATDRINAANKPDIPVEPAAPDAWSGAEAGKGLGEELKGVGQGIAGLFKGPVGVAGKALRAVAPIGDLMAVNDVTGSPLPMLAKATGVDVPSSIGGVPVSQGSPSQLAMDLMGSPTARLNEVGSGISDAAQYVGDKATSAYDQFKNRLDSAQGTGTPYTPPAETSPNVAPWLNEAVNKQQTPAPDKAKFASSANKSEKAAENVQVRDKIFNQGPTTNTTEGHPVGDAVTRLSALAQTDQAMNKTSDTGMGEGSILDSLYSKLKDSDVDYSDLAKRISQNEYDLARERKDGTLNAILGGVGAALSKAGSYEGVGDRVFKPGLGAIAGAGIMGGLKMSAASDEAIDKKSQDNMVAALALKKLKRESMNDVLDAISAQRQVDATLRSQGITAQHYADVSKHQAVTEGQENKKIDILGRTADINAAHTNAQIAELASRNPDQKAAIELAQTKANNAERNLASVRSGAHMPDDPSVMSAQKEYDNAMATLNYLLQSLKVPVAPAGSASPVRGPNDIKVLSREAIK